MSARIKMAAGLAGVVVALGAPAAMASASTAGGSPSPSPSSSEGHHHHGHHARTVQFCFYSLLTETDTLGGVQINPGDQHQQGDQGGKGGQQGGAAPTVTGTPDPSPSSSAPSSGAPTGQPGGDQGGPGYGHGRGDKSAELVEVVQLVKVCETIKLDRRHHDEGGGDSWGNSRDNWGDNHGRRGEVIAVTAEDVSAPFAFLFDPSEGPAAHAPAFAAPALRG